MRTLLLKSFLVASVALAGATGHGAPVNILWPGDPIFGIWDTTVGGDSTPSSPGSGAGQYPAAQAPPSAIDGDVSTKYLNFGDGAESGASTTKGVGTGFYVTPTFGPSVVDGLRFATANDHSPRDPITITLEGSNATGADLTLGANWTHIYSGPTGLQPVLARNTYGDVQTVSPSDDYTSYRVLVASQRDAANSVQYSEVELFVAPPHGGSITDITPTYQAGDNYNRMLIDIGADGYKWNFNRTSSWSGSQQYMWFNFNEALDSLPADEPVVASAWLSWSGLVETSGEINPVSAHEIGVFAVPEGDTTMGQDSVFTSSPTSGNYNYIVDYYAANTPVDEVSFSDTDSSYVFDATWDVTSLVQDWLDNPNAAQRGELMLLHDATAVRTRWGTAGNYGTPGAPGPRLIVTTMVPEPGTWLLLLSAVSCGMLMRRRRQGR